MNRSDHRHLGVAVLALAALAARAGATQHLVAPGDRWQDLGDRLRPGDEIILMPGRHRPATFVDIAGTAQQPIVIRSADPDHPSVIAAEREGLRLLRPSHVTVRDLTIDGATIAGLVIEHQDRAPSAEPAPDAERWAAHATVQNVLIKHTGPSGKRHAVRLTGVEHVMIDTCQVAGWGGAAIEVQGCGGVTIRECGFMGVGLHSQEFGVHVAAGSENVRIERCRFDDAGGQVVSLGVGSTIERFIPPVAEKGDAGRRSAASKVRVTNCVIAGGDVAFAFDRAVDCLVRNNTVVKPGRHVLVARDDAEQADIRVSPLRQITFGSNLIVWEPPQAGALAAGERTDDRRRFIIEQNLWWSPQAVEAGLDFSSLPAEPQWEQ
ncbi:MAG: right-handed parallel beta-helix repeat-containing protein, partial [Planctomycetota bacterium]